VTGTGRARTRESRWLWGNIHVEDPRQSSSPYWPRAYSSPRCQAGEEEGRENAPARPSDKAVETTGKKIEEAGEKVQDAAKDAKK